MKLHDLVTIDEPTSPNFGRVGVVTAIDGGIITIERTVRSPAGKTWGVNLDGSATQYPRSIVRRVTTKPLMPLYRGVYWEAPDDA